MAHNRGVCASEGGLPDHLEPRRRPDSNCTLRMFTSVPIGAHAGEAGWLLKASVDARRLLVGHAIRAAVEHDGGARMLGEELEERWPFDEAGGDRVLEGRMHAVLDAELQELQGAPRATQSDRIRRPLFPLLLQTMARTEFQSE